MVEQGSTYPQRVALGIIRKPIGLKGFCAVEMFGDTLRRLSLPVPVCAGKRESECRPLLLEEVEFRHKGPVCLFKGIYDIDRAESLRGESIYIDTSELPGLEEDSYYHFELRGLTVRSENGQIIGEVEKVHNFPTVDSIEVKRSRRRSTLMLPLTADAIKEIDTISGYITVRHSFIEDLM